MHQVISVTEAARNFSDVINRVYYQGQTYLLTRGGVVVAQLATVGKTLSAKELIVRWEARPRLDPGDAADWEQDLVELKATVAKPEGSVWDS
jgi:antitoxin (DNA-binding transcriptional repressor) of toxin-antitoxin stability system